MNDILVRPGLLGDLDVINSIYNHYVCHTHVTFDIEPWPMTKRLDWFSKFDGKVQAFAYTGQFRTKAAYNSSAEVTIYSHHQLQTNVTGKGASKGVGKALYNSLLPNLAQFGIHRLYAVIALPNKISMGLHQQMGFKQVAILDEVGSKFGHMISVAMLEKRL
jgi:phosphinothricin acetyltransferase